MSLSSENRKKIASALFEIGAGAITLSIVYIGLGLYARRRVREWHRQRRD